MDKGLLFQFMRVKFREAGFSEAEVDLHIQSLTERYQNKSDEEIEADIKRRGGASRMAAATVERRNTVLMADPDYRAFAEAAQTADANQDRTTDSAPDASVADTVESKEETEEDPLAAWFSAPADKNSEEADMPPLFSDQKPSELEETAKAVDLASDTAQIPGVKPAPKSTAQNTQTNQTVHSIPLFGEAGQRPQMPQRAQQQTKASSAPPLQRAPMPSGTAADLGNTKIVQVPQPEQTAKPAPQPQSRTENQAYRDEQLAIWASSADIRDGKGTPARRTPTADHDTQHSAVHNRTQTPKQQKPKVEFADRGNVTWLQEKTYWGEGSEEGVKRFRIILALAALPITILLLAYAVLAIGLIALMPILMAVFVIGLVVEVAVGSLVALVSVIYGVSQLFIVVPIGMFELGLGVAAIGITMFIGILMYNIAVRLLPFLLRQFIRFQSVFKGFLQDLYYYVKGECYRR